MIAIIPARGGSERVPGKALRLLGGKPLIAWTIDVAKAAGLEPVVATDSVEIGAAAERLGARFMQRVESDPLEGTWAYLRGPLDCGVLLLPTHPFRRARTVGRLASAPGPACGARRSREVRTGRLDDGVMSWDWRPRERTQDYGLYTEAGGMWKLEERHEGPSLPLRCAYAIAVSAIEALDLDTEEDWQIAEALVKAGVV